MNDDQIKRAFTRLQDDVRRTVRPSDGLERVHGRRWWHGALAPAFGIAVLVFAVVLGAALLRGDEPGPVVTTGPGPDTTLPAPDTTVPSPDTTVPSPDPTLPTGVTPIQVATPVVVDAGDLLVASSDGVFLEGPDGVATITSSPSTRAAGDRRGGVVIESEGNLWRVPAGTTEPLLLLQGAELHDVVLVDGEPTVLYGANRQSPTEEVSTIVGIGLLGLDTGRARPLLETEGYEGGVTRVSHGGGAFVITEAAEGYEWFTFVDADGNPLDVANPRPRDYEDAAGDRFADQAVLSPDGSMLYFLDTDEPFVGEGDPIDLVAWDMAGGTETARIELPGGNYEYWFVRMDVRGSQAVVGRLTAGREALSPLIVDLTTGTTTEAGVRGAPSIAGDAAPAPSTPPATGDPAPIPAEGLGRGHAIADYDRIVWHSQPEGEGSAGARLIVEHADPRFGSSWFVFSDLAGGLVYGDGLSPATRLRAGATEPEVLLAGSEETITPFFGVAEIGGEAAGYYVAHLGNTSEVRTIGLESRATTSIATLETGERGWIGNVSFDGDRFLVSAVVDSCPSHFTVDLDGETAAFPALPRVECSGAFLWTEQARLSPDGSLVAYVRAQSDGFDPELGIVLLREPIELVVAEVATGEELAAIAVGTESQELVTVHDFDGRRVIVSRTAPEPAGAPYVMFVFDLACASCTERYDLVTAGGGLTGPAGSLDSVAAGISVPGCSVDGLGGQDLAPAGLPAAVTATRAAIIQAAEACDFEALDALALEGEFFYYFDTGYAGMFAEAEASDPALLRLYRMLGLPFATIEIEGEAVYTWPSAASYDSWDAVPQADRNALAAILSPDELRTYAELGAYYGLRIGITESGDWIYLAAGD